MKKAKKLDINYLVYTALLIRQKLPYFLAGFFIAISLILIIFRKTIISPLFQRRTVTIQKKISEKKYVVREGEDLWQIAEKNYGSGFNAYDIAQVNALNEPYILLPGQELIIPSVAKRFPTQGDIVPIDNIYTVQEGDYLFQIAEKTYGDGNLVYKIIEANKIHEPYTIEVGQKLLIPR